jgi:hypothetical protein
MPPEIEVSRLLDWLRHHPEALRVSEASEEDPV